MILFVVVQIQVLFISPYIFFQLTMEEVIIFVDALKEEGQRMIK